MTAVTLVGAGFGMSSVLGPLIGGALMLGVGNVGDTGWSAPQTVLGILGGLVLWLRYERWPVEPLIDPGLLKQRRVAGTMVAGFIVEGPRCCSCGVNRRYGRRRARAVRAVCPLATSFRIRHGACVYGYCSCGRGTTGRTDP